jgi:hypothetical protein
MCLPVLVSPHLFCTGANLFNSVPLSHLFSVLYLCLSVSSVTPLLAFKPQSVIAATDLPSSHLNRIDWLVEWSVVGSEYYT